MSTTKVLKNKKPATVEITEGTRTAQRKRTPAQAAVDPAKAPAKGPIKVRSKQARGAEKTTALPSPSLTGKSASVTKPAPAAKPGPAAKPVPAPKSPRPKTARAPAPAIPASIAKSADPAAKKKRTKASITAPVQESPAAVDASAESTVTTPPNLPRAPIPEPELWEKDSPVMRRISLLRTRNAQLNEQVLRLKKPL